MKGTEVSHFQIIECLIAQNLNIDNIKPLFCVFQKIFEYSF